MALARKEVEFAQERDHKHLVKYYYYCENRILIKGDGTQKNVTYIVQEYVGGGELYGHIVKKGCFSEKLCRHYFRQMLIALNFLHTKGYAHRDLKPENIVLDSNYNLKIIDFGFCASLEGTKNDGYMRTRVGSMMYMAPEIIDRKPYQGI